MTFLSLLRPHRGRMLALGACLAAIHLLALAVPWGIKIIIDDILPHRDPAGLVRVMVLLSVILLLRAWLNYIRHYQCAMMGERIVCRIRHDVYSKALSMDMPGFQKIGPAQIHTRLTGDLGSLRRFLFGEAIDFVCAVFSTVLLLSVMIAIDVRMAVFAFMSVPFFLVMYARIYPRLRRHYRDVRDAWAQISARCAEILNHVITVRSMNGRPAEEQRLHSTQNEFLQATADTQSLTARLWMNVELFSALCTVGVLWLGGAAVIDGRLSVGELVAFYTYLGMLMSPLTHMIVAQGTYQEGAAALERINEVMNAPAGEDAAERLPVIGLMRGDIAFRDVCFGYESGKRVLHRIDFDIPAGQTVGIVGMSGAGKTTLVKLLLRFYYPDSGRIQLDGRPLDEWNLTEYRRNVAAVLQDDVLFSGTISQNICYGLGEVAREDVVRAARAACAHEFIGELPDGYETMLDERGGGLSSGQRQRIAIARALIRRPAVLILDEATAAVDALTENRIQDRVRDYMRDRTVIIIAHRFSTLSNTDRIIVLEHGRVAEMGSHNNLLNKNGIYSSLYQEQFRETQTINTGNELP